MKSGASFVVLLAAVVVAFNHVDAQTQRNVYRCPMAECPDANEKLTQCCRQSWTGDFSTCCHYSCVYNSPCEK
ncbi:cys-rich secreted peptide protein, putative [Phytophthora infestans T30-4]|uniref:Cys-rich secreted peptide protein, putative n=1 Tax=Phytophthora infestans (strain T30-4) TaxID=403677 RepID=D0NSE1_PHYIT|nr:cys-rich secreted peptide protein, putative [Phytophthora infestans T30-4]EEY64486.1 cys-rich secreted peptide protein, putative [Phytophthora infestans T30-4]|eukprot:XP_002897989.1 cys-rich secreted peptide protein, putative [Phytophthora infestans T30-4]